MARSLPPAGRAVAGLILGAAVILGPALSQSAGPLEAVGPSSVHVGVAGDLGQTSNTDAVLGLVRTGGYDAVVAAGDMSYTSTGSEQLWCDYVKSIVGEGFPFELLAGNHESNGQNGNINDFSSCLPNQLPGAVGTYGRQYYVDVPRVDPLVRLVMVGANLTFPDGWYDYSKGSARYNWTAAAIDDARARAIPWVVVTTHLNCLGIGNYDCPMGRDLLDLAMDKKVDLVVTGHDHLYGRTHLLSTGPSCPTATQGYDVDCIVDSGADGVYDSVDGTILATVGTGGQSLYPVNIASPNLPYFAAHHGDGDNPTYGLLDLTVGSDTLTGRYLATDGGLRDQFSLTRVLNPPSTPPAAPTAFAAAPTATPSIQLSWSHSGTGVQDFVLRRDGSVIATLPAAARTYDDTDVTRSSTYTYSLQARGPDGQVSLPATTTATVPASIPAVLVPTSSMWFYRFTAAAAPPTGWQQTGFAPSSWPTGQAPLGYGGTGYLATNIDVPAGTTRPLSAQLRRDFVVTDPSLLPNVTITTHANDGIVVYVNGTEVGRANMPSGPITWATYATAAPTTAYATAHPVVFSVPQSLLRAGTNTVAVEVHLNYRATTSISMELDMRNVVN
jgi:hypothetical protein